MILRGFAFTLLLVTVLLLQAVTASGAAIAGVTPSFVVVSVLCVGMTSGSGLGLRYGFVAGLAVDLLTGAGATLGTSALLLLMAGYAAGQARPFIAASEVPGRMIVGGLGTGVVILADMLFSSVLGRDVPPVGPLAGEVLGGAVYAAVLAPIACLLIARLDRIRTSAG